MFARRIAQQVRACLRQSCGLERLLLILAILSLGLQLAPDRAFQAVGAGLRWTAIGLDPRNWSWSTGIALNLFLIASLVTWRMLPNIMQASRLRRSLRMRESVRRAQLEQRRGVRKRIDEIREYQQRQRPYYTV